MIQVAAARPEVPAAIAPAVVWKLVDALQDGVALSDGGGTLALANLRLEEMLGYQHAELIGRPVESLMPAELHAVTVATGPPTPRHPGPGRWAPGRGWSPSAKTEPRSRPRSALTR